MHGVQVGQLNRDLSEVTQQYEAVSRLYEAESAVAAQCADMVNRNNDSISQLEERVSEACSLRAAAEQQRDDMEQQLHHAQVPTSWFVLLNFWQPNNPLLRSASCRTMPAGCSCSARGLPTDGNCGRRVCLVLHVGQLPMS